jgi:hypothetical protein
VGNPVVQSFAVPLNQKARFSADGEAFWGLLGGDSLNRTGLLTSGPCFFPALPASISLNGRAHRSHVLPNANLCHAAGFFGNNV